jgi:hypothetical protein
MRSIRSGVWWLCAAAFVALVYLSYFSAFPIPEFIAKVSALIFIAALLAGMWGTGTLLFRPDEDQSLPAWFALVARMGAGAGVLSTFIVVVGLVPGPLRTKISWVATLLALTAFLSFYRADTRFPKRKYFNFDLKLSLGEFCGVFFGSLGWLLTFVACFSPITYYDSLVYHLALPEIYLRQGSLAVIPNNLYSFFPGLMEMLHMFVMRFLATPDSVINLLDLSMSVGITIVLVEWAYELLGRKAAVVVFILWWTCPAVLFLSLGAYVDIPLAFWGLVAVRFFSFAVRDQKNKYFLWAGIFSGFAFATKYTGVTVVMLLGIFILVDGLKRKGSFCKQILFFSIGASIAPLPWLLKNFFAVGNPIFPFAYKFLGTGDVWSGSSAAHYFRLLTEYDHTSQFANWLIHTPSLLINQPLKFGGGFDVLGDFGWPVFLLAFPLFFFQKEIRGVRWLGVYTVCSVLIWYFSKPVLRFLVPVLPLFVLTVGVTLILLATSDRSKKTIVFWGIVPWLVSNLFLYVLFANDLKLFDVAIGAVSRPDFLNRRLIYEPAYDFINGHLTDADRIFLLGEQRTYRLQRPFDAANLFAESPLANVCNHSLSANDALAYFRDNHITYLLISEGEIARLGGLGAFGFDANGSSQLYRFIATRTAVAFEERSVKLLQIRY